MRRWRRKTREQRILDDFRDALFSSISRKALLADTFSLLARLVPADRAALCITRPGSTSDYFWELANVPPAWFANYTDKAEYDLVRNAVLLQPNRVLCESEIASPRAFEENPWVQDSLQLGMKLSHVMAVLISSKEMDWHGGITLYREQRRAFSERQRLLLEREVVPSLRQAIDNCRLFREEVQHRKMVEWLFQHHKSTGMVVLVPPGREVMRTMGTTDLLDKWFLPYQQRQGGLPQPLLDQFAIVLRLFEQGGAIPDGVWWDRREDESLKVSFVVLPREGEQPRKWAWVLEEIPHKLVVPWDWRDELSGTEREIVECWRKIRPDLAREKGLTPREVEIAQLAITGREIAQIAKDYKCSAKTVRVHLHNIYEKLSVEGLADLLRYVFEHG